MCKIYEPKGRAREYSPLALNYFKGCDNGCVYCYVPNMMRAFNSKYEHESVIKPIDFKELELSAKKMQGIGKQILLSFTSDPYCNAEDGETRYVLEILNKYEHKVVILTKNPTKAIKDIDLFLKFGNRFKIGSTLTFDNKIDSEKWEQGADEPKNRIKSLEFFAKQGVKTWASFEPVIVPSQSLNLMKSVVGFIDHVKIGKINNYQGLDKTIDWNSFLKSAVEIMRECDMSNRFYIKKDLLLFNNGIYLSENEINEDFLNL